MQEIIPRAPVRDARHCRPGMNHRCCRPLFLCAIELLKKRCLGDLSREVAEISTSIALMIGPIELFGRKGRYPSNEEPRSCLERDQEPKK
jgi:hypothetical protein